MVDYRVSTENFVKDCKAALQATNRQVKTKKGTCDLVHYFEQCFGTAMEDNGAFRQARQIRHRIAHGNRVGGNKKKGDVWQRISTNSDTVCYQAAIAMLSKIGEIDSAFVDCFGQNGTTFKPVDGSLQGFTSKTTKMTAEQTKVVISAIS